MLKGQEPKKALLGLESTLTLLYLAEMKILKGKIKFTLVFFFFNGDMRPSFNPGLGRSPGEGNRYPLQYPCLENPHGQRSLMRYRVWDRRESEMTEQLTLSQLHILQSIFRGLKKFFFSHNKN